MYSTRYLTDPLRGGMLKNDIRELDSFSCTVENLGIILQKTMPLHDKYMHEYRKWTEKMQSQSAAEEPGQKPQRVTPIGDLSDSEAKERFKDNLAGLANQFAEILLSHESLLLDLHVLTRMKQCAVEHTNNKRLLKQDENIEFTEEVYEHYTSEMTVLFAKLSSLRDEVHQQNQWKEERFSKGAA